MTYREILLYLQSGITNPMIMEQVQEMLNNSRCSKCVWEGTCRDFDRGSCNNYKRDPPDGGYYG